MDIFEAPFSVGAWQVEPQNHRIVGPGGAVSVQPKMMKVLVCLVRHAGETVTRDALIEDVWTDTDVADHVLNQAISRLRKAFSTSGPPDRVIETVPKKGYRLVAPVQRLSPATPAPLASTLSAIPQALPSPQRSTWWPLRTTLLLVGALVGVGYLLAPAQSTPLLRMQPLTSTPGIESQAAFSPDGEHVAYVWIDEDWNADIYITRLDDHPPQRITDSPLFEYDPAWSPDGTQLAYYAFAPLNRADCSIYIKPIIGGPAQKIASCNRTEQQRLAWSPDGEWLAYQKQDPATGDYFIELLSMDTAKRHPATLPASEPAHHTRPVFSPDGKSLLFRHQQHGSWAANLYVVPVSTQPEEPRLLFQNRSSVMGYDWAPDGKHILFLAARDDNPSALWHLPVSGGEPTLLHLIETEPGALTVARKGKRMVYEGWHYESNIWRVAGPATIASTDTLHPLIESTRFDLYPAYSPTGEQIAFISSRSGFTEIWTSDANGENQTRITALQTDATRLPRWSPDGSHLVFQTNLNGQSDLYLIDPQDKRPLRLTMSPSEDLSPSWSRDGAFIYFASDRSGTFQIWKVPATGGDAIQQTHDGGFVAFESPDGTSLFFDKPNAPGIWQLTFDTGNVTQVTNRLQPLDSNSWTLTDTGLYFIERQRPMVAPIRRIDLQTGETTTVTYIRHNVGPGFDGIGLSVSPDERWILFGKIDNRSSDLMLLESL